VIGPIPEVEGYGPAITGFDSGIEKEFAWAFARERAIAVITVLDSVRAITTAAGLSVSVVAVGPRMDDLE
jgi:hypothetical protein